MSEPLLEVNDLTVKYQTDRESVTAVSNVSFQVQSGEYFGLVGESGCGKSTLANAIIGGLDHNGEVSEGEILYKGTDLRLLTEREFNEEIRWKEISWIPQGSMNSLDPLFTIKQQALAIANSHTSLSKSEALQKFKDMFEVVGLPKDRMNDYPHQFSGGMKQRAMIAFALFLEPSIFIADEPTTALDVIMQDQIFSYFDKINAEIGTSMILITHDISLVFESCAKMAVMHSGQVAEVGRTDTIFDYPTHPYTIALERSFPDIRHPDRELHEMAGNPPQTRGTVDYCTFKERCPWAAPECTTHEPHLERVERSSTDPSHRVSCHRKTDVINDIESGQAHNGD